MAIAFDAAANGNYTYSAGSITYAHTCTGSDRILFVSYWTGGSYTSVSATYNGVSNTGQLDVGRAYTTGSSYFTMVYFVAPATGSNNIVATVTNGDGAMETSSSSYTGVDQTTPIDVHTTGNASSSPNAQSSPWSYGITSTVDNCWAVMLMGSEGGNPTNAGTGTTRRAQEPTLRQAGIFDNGSAKTPAGLITLEISGWGGSRNCYAVACTIIPVGGGGGGGGATYRRLATLGVGQ